MENFSLSDVAAVTKDNDGWGGGSAWVMIILFALIFGWGGSGFGGGGNALTDIELCQANNFTQLQNSVGRLNDSIAQQNMMLSNGMCNLGYQNLEQFGNLQRDLCTGFANGVAATNQAAYDARECCCETNRNIDSVRYENAMNTASINSNIDAKFAAIEKAQLEAQIAAQQNQINQLNLQAQMCGVVRYPLATTYGAGSNPFFSGCGC
jgi:hypothetical protein